MVNDHVKYHISENFSSEIDKALNGELGENSQVKARDYTPEVLVKNGVRDLPMLITQRHVKSIIYTEEEARKLGLKTGGNNHYHGLGKELLIKSVDSMDAPLGIYKQDYDHYLIVTEIKNSSGDNIIVPVKIDGKGTYNNVYIDENQILSVYGKKNLENYLERNNFQCVYQKNGTALNPEVQFLDISNSTTNSISQNQQNATGKIQHSLSKKSRSIAPIDSHLTYGRDIALEKIAPAQNQTQEKTLAPVAQSAIRSSYEQSEDKNFYKYILEAIAGKLPKKSFR